jgi:hypothetical protein
VSAFLFDDEILSFTITLLDFLTSCFCGWKSIGLRVERENHSTGWVNSLISSFPQPHLNFSTFRFSITSSNLHYRNPLGKQSLSRFGCFSCRNSIEMNNKDHHDDCHCTEGSIELIEPRISTFHCVDGVREKNFLFADA